MPQLSAQPVTGRLVDVRCDDAGVEAASIAGRTIVIVDDHPSFRAAARFMLEADGFQVVAVAIDGESGGARGPAHLARDRAARRLAAGHRRLRGRVAPARGRRVERDRLHLEPRRVGLRLAHRRRGRLRLHSEGGAQRRRPARTRRVGACAVILAFP